MEKVKVGIIGCGNISDIYLKNCTETFNILEVAAVADLIPERAQAKAEKYGINKACTVEELLADPEIKIVINLTIPKAHAEVCIAALEAGKHVHVEKPLSITREDAKKIMDKAKEKGLLVGCAPDTFLGGGIQTCIKLINDGWIGKPVAATAFMTCHGHESWHPDPEFYYKKGGGPMLDMGPYYLTALVSMLGPVKRVTGSTKITYPERTITSQPKFGTKIEVEVPTHVAGVMDFESGAVGTIITSFDVWSANLPRIEIYGSAGSLSVPDPNTFGGPVLVRRAGQSEWMEVPLTHGYSENSRGLGVADMAYAILNSRKNRASGELAYHVLDIMQGFHDASDRSAHYVLESTCSLPKPLPLGLFEEEIFR
jgi:predicted dehydrogenase